MTANLLVNLHCSILEDPAPTESSLGGLREIVSILLGYHSPMKDTDGPIRFSQCPSVPQIVVTEPRSPSTALSKCVGCKLGIKDAWDRRHKH